MDRIYLVPGFFGFANLGDLRYFGHVADFLHQLAPSPIAVHVVPTLPTASLTQRALSLHAAVDATAARSDRLHIVGHSSGGLDARLWASPEVRLPEGVEPRQLAAQLRTVVSVATPHRGTPSAEVFTTVAGKRLLRLLSLMTIVVVRNGGTPLKALLQIGDLFVGVDRILSATPHVMDELFERLLRELSEERRGEVEAFFQGMGEDQGLLPQLMPDAMQLFEASTNDRPGVRYGCVVTRAAPPRLSGVVAAGASPIAQTAYAWYALSWQMASRLRDEPSVPDDVLVELRRHWPELGAADNDGMVPTLSQARGELIRAVDADHLDVLGHFGDADQDPPSFDWFHTGTGFTRPQFEATWTDVGHFIVDA